MGCIETVAPLTVLCHPFPNEGKQLNENTGPQNEHKYWN